VIDRGTAVPRSAEQEERLRKSGTREEAEAEGEINPDDIPF
jgi:hypothetical protein